MSWESISEVDVPLENRDEDVDAVSPLLTDAGAREEEVSAVNLECELAVDVLSRAPLLSLETVVAPVLRG